MTFGEKLQLLRKQNNLSQEQLAAQLNVSRQAISKWESNTSLPDMANVVLLSEIFHVSTDYFLKDRVENTESEDIKQRIRKYIASAKKHIPEVIVCAVVVVGIFIACIICFIQNAHMKSKLRSLEELILSGGSNIVLNNDSVEEESLLAVFESSYKENSLNVEEGIITVSCAVVPKEFQPGQTEVSLIFNQTEYPMELENGKYVAELAIPVFEESEISAIQIRESENIRTQLVQEHFSPHSVLLPHVQASVMGNSSYDKKDGKFLLKRKGKYEIELTGNVESVESISILEYMDGKEYKKINAPLSNKSKRKWDGNVDPPDVQVFYYEINKAFTIPFGSTFDLYMEVVDGYGLRYRARAEHLKVDKEGKLVEDGMSKNTEASIYNKDGKLMYDGDKDFINEMQENGE